MEESWLKKNYKKVLTVAVGVILILTVFFVRYAYVTLPRRALLCACDAFFAIGILYLVWGAILFAVSKGAADGIMYIMNLRRSRFTKRGQLNNDTKYTSYYDFSNNRPRRPNSAKLFAVFGGVSTVISIILLVIYSHS